MWLLVNIIMIVTPSGPLTRPEVWLLQVHVQHIIATNRSLPVTTNYAFRTYCMYIYPCQFYCYLWTLNSDVQS